jgi:hypothetical protein
MNYNLAKSRFDTVVRLIGEQEQLIDKAQTNYLNSIGTDAEPEMYRYLLFQQETYRRLQIRKYHFNSLMEQFKMIMIMDANSFNQKI